MDGWRMERSATPMQTSMANFTQVRGGTALHLQANLLLLMRSVESQKFLLTLSSSRSRSRSRLHSHSAGSTTLRAADDVVDVRRLSGPASFLATSSHRASWQQLLTSVLGLMSHLQPEELAYWSHEICAFTQAVAEVVAGGAHWSSYTIVIDGHFDIRTGATSGSPSVVDPSVIIETTDGRTAASSSPVVAAERREDDDGLMTRTVDGGLGTGVGEEEYSYDVRPDPHNMASVEENLFYVNRFTTSPILLIDDYFGPAITSHTRDAGDGSDEFMRRRRLRVPDMGRSLQEIDVLAGEINALLQVEDLPVPADREPASARQALIRTTYAAGEGSSQVRGTGCAICLEDFDEGAELSVTPCSHAFHRRCLLPWLVRRPSCPLCRFYLRLR